MGGLETLIGRARECARLETLLAEESVRVVLITGPAGVGRTSLGEWLLNIARTEGLDAVELSSRRPVLDAAVITASAERARVVFFDDLERLSSARLEVLLERATQPSPPWRLLVATLCPDRMVAEARQLVQRAIAAGRAEPVLVYPLSVADSVELVARTVGPAAPLVRGLVERAVSEGRGLPAALIARAEAIMAAQPPYRRVALETAWSFGREGRLLPDALWLQLPRTRRSVPQRARLASLAGAVAIEAGAHREALAAVEEALRLVRPVGDPAAASHAQALAALVLVDRGELRIATARLQRARAALRRRPMAGGVVLSITARSLLLAGQPQAALRDAGASLALLRTRPPGPAHAMAAVVAAWCLWRSGRLAAAGEMNVAAAAITGAIPLADTARLTLDCLLAAEHGERAQVRALTRHIINERLGGLPRGTAAWTGWALGRALLGVRELEHALRWLQWAEALHVRHGSLAGEAACLPDLVAAEIVCRRLQPAVAAAGRLELVARQLPSRLHTELVARSLALVALAQSRPRQAASVLTPMGATPAEAVVERAHTLRVTAMVGMALGQTAEARELLRTAHELALSAGARAEAARCRVALERSGPTVNEALSDRERQVVELVAEGLTNRQIAASLGISERTAAHHVAHALAKLSLPNRTRLATWARGLAPADPAGLTWP